MYRCIYLLVVFLMLQAPVFAQSGPGDRYRKSFDRYKDRKERKFDRYVRKQEDKFDAYRAKVNAEFGAYMKRKWAAYYIKSAFMPPLRKEPVLPPVFVPDDVLPEDITVPSGQILSRPLSEEPVPRPEPVVPFEGDTEDQAADAVSFDFYGTACTVHVPKTRSAGLSGISEEDVSLMWSELSSGAYDASVADCLSLRDRMRLCDWGYLRLVEEISSVMAGDDTNAASVIQFYILTQSGYNVRLSRSGESLVLLVPSLQTIYGRSYLELDGIPYYVTGSCGNGESFYVFDREYPQEKVMSMAFSQPLLSDSPVGLGTFSSSAGISANIAVDRNLLDYYEDYPHCSWEIYADASLSDDIRNSLYPVLRDAIRGKSETEAAGILLNFVQTAFEYKTDMEQFGYERSFFGDETFAFPYSDCEDRAILYSILVRELLGLDMVLLHYPDHLSSAVRFSSDVPGDNVIVNGERYVICDPTYINAGIGRCIPQYRTVQADVICL